MYIGKLVFSLVTEYLPMHTFRHFVQRYGGNRKVRSSTCLDQHVRMVFAQLTYRESLRNIEVCLRAQQSKLYHMGVHSKVSPKTPANANKVQD